MRKKVLNSMIAAALCLFLVSLAGHAAASPLLVAHQQGAVTLNGPDYDWWHGCSPTSAGMMMGYYDREGYAGLSYGNLVPGGTAESSTYGAGPYLANAAIASSGHITDFYSGGTGASGDDNYQGRAFDSLADFMGTSQDSAGNNNGWTTFYYKGSGSRVYASDIYGWGVAASSGMLGMWEYFDYAGYGGGSPGTNFYNQYIYGYYGNTLGFTFADYQAEIDAGRVVMLHVDGHSMFGYGYDLDTSEVILHDTWNAGEHRMLWGGSYSGLDFYGVTCFTPTGGTDAVPLPGAVWLLGSGLLALAGFRKKTRN